MADIQEVNAGGIQAIRQLDAEGFVLETTDGKVYRISLPPGVVGPMGPKGDTGPRGEAGEMGSPGADGMDGRDGMNGNDGRNGTSVEFAQVLKDGSLALVLSTGDVINAGKVIGPQGTQGLPGRAGVPGPAGEDGRTIHSFSGPPDGAVGAEGDYAIDHSNWRIYGPKSGLGWGGGQDLLAGRQNNLDAQIRNFSGSSGRTRFFGMGASGTGAAAAGGIGGAGTTGAGLEQIMGYGRPLPTINSPVLVAVDQEGDAMMIDLWGRSATGTDFVEVAAAKGTGTDSGHTTVFDVQMGANPPQLSFSTAVIPGVNPGDPPQLQVYVQSNQPLLELRGRIVKL